MLRFTEVIYGFSSLQNCVILNASDIVNRALSGLFSHCPRTVLKQKKTIRLNLKALIGFDNFHPLIFQLGFLPSLQKASHSEI